MKVKDSANSISNGFLAPRVGRESVSSVPAHLSKKNNTGAFVILARNKNGNVHLKKTLDYLYKHYNHREKDAVVILHEGDFDTATQHEVRGNRPEIKFHQLEGNDWHLYPPTLTEDKVDKRKSIGYHHMVRLFAVRIYPLLHSMGYKWVCRLDDDSLVLSDVPYNIFNYMNSHGYDYAYRALQNEDAEPRWYKFHARYMKQHNVKPGWLCNNITSLDYKKGICGKFQGFYNNFFVARISRFLEKDIQQYLKYVDESGVVYTEDWGDLMLQTAAVKLFLPPSKVHRFTDWTYAHHSSKEEDPKTLWWGIVQLGRNASDPESTMEHIVENVLELRPVNQLVDGKSRHRLRSVDGMYTLSHPGLRLE